MKTTIDLKAIRAQLKKEQKAIAASRDRLRDLVSEYEDVLDDLEQAKESIDLAIDYLSELQ